MAAACPAELRSMGDITIYIVVSCPFGDMETRARQAIARSPKKDLIMWATVKNIPNKVWK